MRTIRNILLGLVALTIGLSFSTEAQNNKLHKKQKSDEKWISIGPANFSGRVLAVHVDSRDPQKIYAGTAGGGLWISINNGISWNHCADYPGSVAVSSITQDASGRIYIGTGEAYGLADPGVSTNLEEYGIAGNGIYYTNDDVNFTLISGTDDFKVVKKLVYSSIDNSIYIGTEVGLKVYSISQGTLQDVIGADQKMVTDLSVGSDGSILYSNYTPASSSTPGVADVLFRQASGSTFTSMCGTSSTKIPNDAGRISIAIAPSNPSVMYAYVTNATTRHFVGVYKSVNGGGEWKSIYPLSSYSGPTGDPKTIGMGNYCNIITVSPNSEDEVFVGTTILYRGTKLKKPTEDREYEWNPVSAGEIYTANYTTKGFFIGTSNGLYRSTNNGISFSQINRYLSNLQIYSFSVANEGQILLSARDYSRKIYLENPVCSIAQGSTSSMLSLYGLGLNSTFSMIKSEAIYYADLSGSIFRMASINSDVQRPSQWYGDFIQLRDKPNDANQKELARWFRSATSSMNQSGLSYPSFYYSNVSPIIFWESVNDVNSIDTIKYFADKTYAPHERICVRSTRNSYPIWIENGSDTLYKDSVINVQDIVTSRFFLGGGSYKVGSDLIGAPVYMTPNALDFNAAQGEDWSCVFRTKDTTEQVIELQVSNDGDHLFVLTRKSNVGVSSYCIYRVSGFDTYRKKQEIEVSNIVFNGSSTIGSDNSLRMLQNDTLMYENQIGDDFISGDILSITLAPNNNDMLLFTSNGTTASALKARVGLITNALTANLDNVSYAVDKAAGLPNGAVYTSIIERKDENMAFVGTEKGIYMTENLKSSNPTWTKFNSGVDADIPVFKLFQQTRELGDATSIYYTKLGEKMQTDFIGVKNTGVIYAATHGLGLFKYEKYHEVSVTPYPPMLISNNALKVYPNPTTDVVTVEFTLLKNEQVQFNVVDIAGRIVYSYDIGNKDAGTNTETLNCSNLPAGIYFVNMKTMTQNKTAKITVTK